MLARKDEGTSSPRRARRFYTLHDRIRENGSGREMLNMKEVCHGSGAVILAPPSRFQTGFRDYSVRPRFRVSKRLGGRPYDIESFCGYWLVSEPAKNFLDELNAADFAYLAVDTEFDPGSEPETYWLCDVISIVDALDEPRSEVERRVNGDGSWFHLTGLGASLAFDENLVGSHSVFRMKTSAPTLICDERFKDAFKQSKLTGLRFTEAFHPPFDKVGTITSLPHNNRAGTVKPEGRGKEVYFHQDALEGLDSSLKIGDPVRVIGRKGEYGYVATRVQRPPSS
jgi:cold shock CspA family protein